MTGFVISMLAALVAAVLFVVFLVARIFYFGFLAWAVVTHGR